ncbi:hypothetical protein [Leifsonia virtsii]|uniref:Uncharacterized protein n=1 Tax=Leifsonia virtsii TaxID=3035915 RepID=A0ABT8J0I3_9MICO|nr:hypothetical protein [Leifsonia virtsii]MDN4598598.1 hypothetical protein [Leifsonia virtsii]
MGLFSFSECAHCGEQQPVLGDGRLAIHFTRDGERCGGSERRNDNDGVSSEQARRIEAQLRLALRQVMGARTA